MMRRLCLLRHVSVLLAVMGGYAHGEPLRGDPATDTALFVTSTLTLIIVALIFLILVMPSADRQKVAAFFMRVTRVFTGKTAREVEEVGEDFDGIRELDNRTPAWFTTLFVGTIVFAGMYLLNYHVFHTSPLMIDEYDAELAAADLAKRIRVAGEGTIDESTLAALTDPEALKSGGERFKKYCVSCHGAEAQGGVGPNLTDDYWIHGGGIRNVFATIKNGVPAKGMISWQLVFTPREIQELASYVLSLRGTNPQNAKKPQGTLYVDKDATTAR